MGNDVFRESESESNDGGESVSRPRALLSLTKNILWSLLRLPFSVLVFLFKPTKSSKGRRAILQGRLWKLRSPAQYSPIVARVPNPQPDSSSNPQPRSISGINIDPVPPTNLKAAPSARTLPIHRPPGAVDEWQFLAGCTRCGDCINACPYDAIRKAPERLGAVAGTPVIEADSVACMMCEDFPCIRSCEPGVLSDQIAPVMGTARITAHLCLAHHSTICTVCSERCPVDEAIVVHEGKPTVNEDRCTGCGVCRYVCPAPENAILLMPAFTRPGIPAR